MAVHDLELSPAQEPQTAEPSEGQGVEGTQQSGIEKRIGELTARYHQAEQSAAKKDEQILALTSQMTQFMTRQQELQQQNQPDDTLQVPEGMDPAQAQYFERMVQRIEAKYEQALVQTQAGIQRSEAASAAAQLAQRFNVGQAQANQIAQRAADLAAGWRQKGLPFAPSDAADFAFMEQLKAGGIQRASLPPPSQYAVTPGAGPVPNYAPQTPRPQLPRNFDSLSPDTQIAVLEKMGVDDLPL